MSPLRLLLLLLLLLPPAYASKGDCDADGKLSSADALLALKMAVGELATKSCADVDADNRVTSNDAAEILLLAVGGRCQTLVDRVKGAAEGAEVEGFAGSLLGDQRIAVEVGEDCSFGIVVDGGKIVSITQGEVKNPTLTASTDYETLETLLASGSTEELKKALETGKIRLRTESILNRFRLGIAKLAMRFT